MNLNELLEDIRTMYVDDLVAAASALKGQGDVRLEAALRDEAGALVREGPHGLGMRVDIAVLGEDATTHAVDSERMIDFEPGELEYENLVVEIAPFMWDAVKLRLEPADAKVEPFVAWFERWFASDEEGDAPYGVVHFMSDPAVEDGALEIDLDLGSASVDAFEDLLDACVAAGVTNAWLGTPTEE
ncbi:MAG: hypothetical protein RIT81_29370 [Deltaproteobacteria bacterium]